MSLAKCGSSGLLLRACKQHSGKEKKPSGLAVRLAFVGIQLLDTFARMTDSVTGLLPDLLGLAGFEMVETTSCY
jgi:hypothetical protein